MVPRVVVFVDYQNTSKSSRATFCEPGAPPPDGQVDPHALGNLIVTRRDIDSELVRVRIYRGQPDPRKDPRGYDIAVRGRGLVGPKEPLAKARCSRTSDLVPLAR